MYHREAAFVKTPRGTRVLASRLVPLALLCVFGMATGCKDDKGPDQGPQAARSAPDQPDAKLDLAVLYVGRPGSEREDDFREFLSTHLSRVATTDGSDFDGTRSEGFDVTILDCNAPKLPKDFGRPVVTIGLDGMRYFTGRIQYGCFW